MAYLEKDFAFEDTTVHYSEAGSGPPLLLIHGSGPGASTIGNWRLVLEPLAARYHVFAMDLIGFGKSGRRRAPPYFDIAFWLRQIRAMVDRMPGPELFVLGHSVSGALALKLAAAEPRVARAMTTGTIGADLIVNDATIRCWTFPETREALIATAEILVHDPRHITPAYLDGRMRTLHEDPTYQAYFSSMFAGDKQRFADQARLTPDELARIKIPLTMMHGRADRAFPDQGTLALARTLPRADVILLADCAHSIALEFPEKLLAACHALFG